MTRETTRFVYVTYIRATPERVFEAIIEPDVARRYCCGGSRRCRPAEHCQRDPALELARPNSHPNLPSTIIHMHSIRFPHAFQMGFYEQFQENADKAPDSGSAACQHPNLAL